MIPGRLPHSGRDLPPPFRTTTKLKDCLHESEAGMRKGKSLKRALDAATAVEPSIGADPSRITTCDALGTPVAVRPLGPLYQLPI